MSPRAPSPSWPDAPKYWNHETSGELAAVVLTYLSEPHLMTVRGIALMRAYLSHWVQSPAWDLNPEHTDRSRAALADLRAGVGAIASAADIRAWLRAALEEGIDPL
ncbi:MAG TPA: hypothetical protein VHY84_27260 [Bryobacteraceae bacterium]|jgi:hypothetical protein|nr:hypothetical protein [Bryobacteraceae bacterium]